MNHSLIQVYNILNMNCWKCTLIAWFDRQTDRLKLNHPGFLPLYNNTIVRYFCIMPLVVLDSWSVALLNWLPGWMWADNEQSWCPCWSSWGKVWLQLHLSCRTRLIALCMLCIKKVGNNRMQTRCEAPVWPALGLPYTTLMLTFAALIL